MHNLIYLLLRRMRVPLIVVILAYAISILGLVLAPGVDDRGMPWHMSFFHAFYCVSYMGSTIGFGEIPYPFSDAQRMVVTVAMYVTVISWLYAIGTLFAVIQDPAFKRVLAYTTFTRAVRRLQEPFYLVCGLGDAGQLILRELTEDGIRCVGLDRNDQRIQTLRLENFPLAVPALTADVTDEVHVHGYDYYLDLTPGVAVELAFVADIPGIFEIELEGSGLLLFELVVR